MSGSKTELLNPVGAVDVEDVLAPRLKDLNGKVIGILDNEMPGSGVLLARIHKRLLERFELAGTHTLKRFAITANPNLINKTITELSEKCDFAIAALGS